MYYLNTSLNFYKQLIINPVKGQTTKPQLTHNKNFASSRVCLIAYLTGLLVTPNF